MKSSVLQAAQNAVAARAGFVSQKLQAMASRDPFWQDVADVFNAAYQNPILTTAEILSDSPFESYAGTGGWGCYGPPSSLPLPDDYKNALSEMWVRDACAQYHAYLGIFADDRGKPEPAELDALGSVIEGIVRTCADFLTRKSDNITVHAFTRDGEPADAGLDYEPDSLAYLVFLAWSYHSVSGSTRHLDDYFWKAMRATIGVLNTNLHTFDDGSALTKTPFRPSDDQAVRAFNIPVNAFCAVAMEQLADLARSYGADQGIAEDAAKLGAALRRGVLSKGVAEHPSAGRILAYETDASVEQNQGPFFIDDANVPSLLSLPYLGFCAADDPLYQAARAFVLSSDNPYFYTGSDGTTQYEGIGSAHTEHQHGGTYTSIWPMAIIMRGMTSVSSAERKAALKMVVAAAQARITCNGCLFGCDNPGLCKKYPPSGYIHESFNANDPTNYTRGWFAWANALFGEWIDTMIREGSLPA
jgi:meiotically up-regulated gene 157 (Mug157) protein